MSYQVERYHDISCGHRVVGHETKCRHLHGHNYRVHFLCQANSLDLVGRVIDFSEIKSRLCMWLEDNWDHKFLAWENDPVMLRIADLVNVWDRPFNGGEPGDANTILTDSVVWVPFNPTAENMAQYLVEVVAPLQLELTGIQVVSCRIEKTRKCTAIYGKG